MRAEFGDGRSQVLVLGHFDTVWPVGELAADAVRAPRRSDHGSRRLRHEGRHRDRHARGAPADANAPRRLPHRIVMLWTTDEEIGSATSRAILEDEARRSRAVFVLEPSLPGGALKTARKGVGDFRVAAEGVAAHAGIDPGKRRERRPRAGAPGACASWSSTSPIAASPSTSAASPAATGRTWSPIAPMMDVDVRVPTLKDGERIASALCVAGAARSSGAADSDGRHRPASARTVAGRRRRSTSRPATSPGRSAGRWKKARPVAAPTETSRPRWASQH